jgi:hypothetical protein
VIFKTSARAFLFPNSHTHRPTSDHFSDHECLRLHLALALAAVVAALLPTSTADSVVATPATDKTLKQPGAGEPLTFENAVNLGDDVRVLWTKAADGSVTGALDAASTGWAAFGFPGAESGSMLGGHVIIVQPDARSATLASARTAELAGYSPDKFVSPSPDLKVDGPLTAFIPATGRIASTFKLTSLPAGNKVMFASGPMNSSRPGTARLGIHPHGQAAVSEIAF